jgi:uncharacterized protein YciI
MFLILLRLSGDKSRAAPLLEAHKAWLQRGFDEGVFLLSGNLQPQAGGGILAHGTTLAELRQRLDQDPFVTEGVVSADIVEIAPSRADPRLGFLLT